MKNHNNKSKLNDITDVLNIYAIGDSFVISKDGSITAGFKLCLPEVHTLHSTDFCKTFDDKGGRDLNSVLINAIENLNVGYIFHQQDIFFPRKSDLPYKNSSIYTHIRNANEKEFMDVITYVFITDPYSSAIDENTFENKRVKLFIEILKIFKISIDCLSPSVMNDDDWVEYYGSLFSCDFNTSHNNKTPLELSFEKNKIGDYNISSYAIRGDKHVKEILVRLKNPKYSSETQTSYNSWIYPLCWEIPCIKIVNNIIKRTEKDTFQRSLREYAGRIGFFSSQNQASLAAEEFALFLDDNKNAIPVYHTFSVYYIYPDENKKKIEEAISTALEKVKFKETRLSLNVEFLFLNTIAGGVSRLSYPDELAPALLNEAVCFCNLEGSSRQSNNGLVVQTREEQPILLDLFNEPFRKNWIANRNMLVIGPSGSGKSYSFNLMLNSLIEQNWFILMIDIGGSYKMQTDYWTQQSGNASYIELDASGKSLSFNPFILPLLDPYNIPDDDIREDFIAELEIIVGLIFTAWGIGITTNTNQYMYNILKDFYKWRYDNKLQHVDFSMFFDYVCKLHEQGKLESWIDFAEFQLNLKKYVKGEEYGELFNSKENILDTRGKNLVVFELENVENRDLLYRITLHIILILIKRTLLKSENPNSLFMFDEAWRLLAEENFGLQIKYLYKTVRKKGAVGMVFQDFDDVAKSTHASAIVNNSSIFVVLPFEGKKTEIIKYAPFMGWTPAMVNMIQSLSTQNRGIFMQWGAEHFGVYRMISNPVQNFLYTTTKSEVEARKQYLKLANGRVNTALNKYLEDKRNNEAPF